MLKIDSLHFSYDTKILQDVSFQLKKGKFLGIVGRSGGGKTSLLKIIGGYLTQESGTVQFNGQSLVKANEMLVPGYKNIALVHQDFGLNLYHTVRENIQEIVLYLPKKLQDQLINEMFDLLELAELSGRQAISLSGGEQQRLSIARALASETDLILMDEPFVHLDSPMRRRLFDYLEKLKHIRDTSFVIVTHNGEEILGLCDEVIYLKKGKIKRKGKPNDFYEKPRSIEEAEFFGLINSVSIKGKRKLFRPDQYSLVPMDKQELKLEFVSAMKQGPIYYNRFKTERNELILLYNFESMKTVNCIYV